MRHFNKNYLNWDRITSLTNMVYKPLLNINSNNNILNKTFIGQGYTKSITPNLIVNHFLQNPKIYTPYTPYQSEISQGRLELFYNYQTMISEINKQDISVASLIDTGQAAMDLVSISKTFNKSKNIYVHENFNQSILNCMNTRAKHQGMNIKKFKYTDDIDLNDTNSIFIQSPDNIGNIIDLEYIETIPKNIPKILHCNLMSNIYYDINSDKYDFCFGNGGNFGIPLGYGGPQPIFLSSKKEYIRKLPGKIVGKSVDTHNKESYRLALQTREQHIKRERATSNICTNQALLAGMSVAWYIYHGKNEVRNIANDIYSKTQYLNDNLNGNIINDSFYDTITINNKMFNKNILNDLDNNSINYFKHTNSSRYPNISFTIDETHTINDIDNLLKYLDYNTSNLNFNFNTSNNKTLKKRNLNYLNQDIFNNWNQEQKIARYLSSLEKKDFSLLDGMIPLGSCTMKYNSPESMAEVSDPKYNIHPWIDINKTPLGQYYNFRKLNIA